jgi:hypothetical protein
MSTEFDKTKTMKIYATSANRFAPDESAHYLPKNLFISGYHGYFDDLMKHFRGRTNTPHYKPVSAEELNQFFQSSKYSSDAMMSGAGITKTKVVIGAGGISSVLILGTAYFTRERQGAPSSELLLILVDDKEYAISKKSAKALAEKQIVDDEAGALIIRIQGDFKVDREEVLDKISDAWTQFKH